MITNETREQLEARGWDFEDEFIPGGGGGSTLEYLDVSGASPLVKESVVKHAVYVKAFVRAYYTDVVGMTLFGLSEMTDDPIAATSAIAIDFTAEEITGVWGNVVKRTVADAVLLNGATQAEIDALPRISKEQFYDLNA